MIEADEYDSAFFDKRAKFIHYHPKTLVLNNLEYDHADIYPDLDAIKQQFHYLVRTVPGNGLIIRHGSDANLVDVLAKGCWTPEATFGSESSKWRAILKKPDGSHFTVLYQDKVIGDVSWQLLGLHNVHGIGTWRRSPCWCGSRMLVSALSLSCVKRRLEVKECENIICL